MKRSRLWLLFPILSVFMIIFAFWLSRQEGSYKQAMELSFEPVQDMFTIELQAEEKYMEPHVSDGDTELMWESATGNGKSYLRIKGKLPKHRLGKPVALRIESDSGNKIREMEILSVSGISAAGCQIDVVKDDTWPLYIGFSLAINCRHGVFAGRKLWSEKEEEEVCLCVRAGGGIEE